MIKLKLRESWVVDTFIFKMRYQRRARDRSSKILSAFDKKIFVKIVGDSELTTVDIEVANSS